jgi:predicted NBD/HSP70 family sugar kinase
MWRGDLVPSAVLGLLGTRGPTSRTDIARALGVSPASVTQATKDLIGRGLVEELDLVPSQGGRPARLLGLVESAGAVVGAKVTADHVVVVEAGLDGSVRRSTTHPFRPRAEDALHDLVAILRSAVAGQEATLLGVGVGVPGAVDSQASGVVDAPTIGWSQVPVGPALRQALDVPVLVDNDVNTLAAAERLYGVGRELSSYLVVTIGRGVGLGIVVDGSVYRGAHGGAGELGHVPVHSDGPLCGCGSRGCLEGYVGEAGLLRRATEAGAVGSRGTLRTLLKAARSGDERALGVYREAGELLGRALAGVVQVLDPETVVVLGEGIDAWPLWQPGFDAAMRRHLLPSRRDLPVVVETWTEDSWAVGAASLVLATPFDAEAGGDQARLVRARLQQSALRAVR